MVVLSQVFYFEALDVENSLSSLIFADVQQGEITLLLLSHQVQGKRFLFPPPKLRLHEDGGFQKGNSCLGPRLKAMGLQDRQEFLFSIFLLHLENCCIQEQL